ncbi:MAG: GerMN domain-containing protein [Lachnospiraceae bacterium]|nr:GerMN domain-containing protein [Lachnospiraceae bacterium]
MRNLLILNLIFVLMLSLTACSSKKVSDEKEEKKEYKVYYLNLEENAIVGEVIADKEPDVKTLVNALFKQPKSNTLKQTLGVDVGLIDYDINGKQLVMNFNGAYDKLSKQAEVLFRACVVKTLCQSSQVDYVSFEIAGEPLLDSKGELVGVMDSESFISNAGDEFNMYEKTPVTLYFSNETGDGLIPVTDDAIYSSNTPLEKVVIQKLIEGPAENSGVYATLPSDTKLNNISIKDGIAYISLDSEAVNSPNNISEEIALYSIVNTITGIKGINRVQISINDDADRFFRESFPLSEIYEKNMDLVINNNK